MPIYGTIFLLLVVVAVLWGCYEAISRDQRAQQQEALQRGAAFAQAQQDATTEALLGGLDWWDGQTTLYYPEVEVLERERA